MTGSPKLFGFDIRKPGVVAGGAQGYGAASAPFRPAPDGARPWITFDKYVNPSVFVLENEAGSQQTVRPGRIPVRRGTNVGLDLFLLWDDAADMVANYPYGEAAGDAAFAYSWCDLSARGVPSPDDDTFRVLISREVNPPALQNARTLIGYDIVSPFFISALAGYDHAYSGPAFVETMKKFINPVGLVTADASEATLAHLVTATQVEIDEDPFFAVGLHLLWDHSDQITKALA